MKAEPAFKPSGAGAVEKANMFYTRVRQRKICGEAERKKNKLVAAEQKCKHDLLTSNGPSAH